MIRFCSVLGSQVLRERRPVPRPTGDGWVDFIVDDAISPNEITYSAQKVDQTITLYDSHFDDLLYGQLVPSNAKLRWMELDSPPAKVELRSTGSMSWTWEFVWEGDHVWSWGRSVGLGGERSFTLSASRKPDPSFPVAIYTPASKRKSATLQLLDYNLARVDPAVSDKKGFEILTCLSLLSFLDHVFDPTNAPLVAGTSSHASSSSSVPLAKLDPSPEPAQEQPASTTSWLRQPLIGGTNKGKRREEEGVVPPVMSAPSLPSRVKARTPTQLSTNEVLVSDPGALDAYCASCLKLLADPSNMYVALLGQTASTVPLVVKLAADVKWKHYQVTGEDLKTFIDDGGSGPTASKTPKDYVPPSNVKVYISRLDELAQFLPLYRPRPPQPPRPILRPPINLDSPATPPRPPQLNTRLAKGRK